MQAWMLYLILLSQIGVFFWLALPVSVRMVYRGYLARNHAYVAATPDFARRYPPPRLTVLLSYLVGVALMAGLTWARWRDAQGLELEIGFTLSLLAFLAIWLAYAAFGYRRVFKQIPLPAKRSASLVPRTLATFIRPAWLYLAFALIGAVAIVYLAGYATGRIESSLFAARMGGLLTGAAIGSLCLQRALHRKDKQLDVEFGPVFRKASVLLIVGILMLLGLVGVWRAVQDFLHVLQFSDELLFAGMSVFYQVVLLLLVCHPVARKLAAPLPDALSGHGH